MKKLQGNTAAKICAVIVLLAASFATGVFGMRTIFSLPAVISDSWQDSYRFSNAREERRRGLTESVFQTYRLNTLEQLIEAGSADASLQADAEALRESREEIARRFSRENTEFRFRLMDANTGEVMGSNLAEGQSMIKSVQDVYRTTFELTEEEYDLYGFDRYVYSDYGGYDEMPPTSALEADQDADGTEPVQPLKLVLEYGVPEELNGSIQDEFHLIRAAWMDDRASFDQYLTGLLSMSALTLIALIWILWTAGHKSGVEGIVTTWQERIFFDVYAAAMIAAGTFCLFAAVWAAEETYYHSSRSLNWAMEHEESFEIYSTMGIMGTAVLCTGLAVVGTLLLRTFAVRLKARCLLQTTLLCRVWRWTVRTVHEFVRSLPLTWKVVLGFGGYTLLIFWLITAGRYDGMWILVFLMLQLVLLMFAAWWALNYFRLRKGTKTIAKGDLEYQIETRHMPYDLRLQAEDLNNISAGLSSAVDEKIKSERFKAELITNVSHDLKTPLTSIINYVNLLKKTEQTDPKAVEYIEVLDRKSQRLKKLTEDLVEASKASTGVLAVTREKIGMSQLIDQALGEWEERLTQQRLTLVTTLPEGETWVYADGRHLWRVIDNLLSNCAKYAMEGTRIYLDLERGKGQVTLSVKNISRDPLNVPADRLMERFVRGEESRSTEGSGLGLSIARSLTELQGGVFELAVDGDLFKATVTLPQAN